MGQPLNEAGAVGVDVYPDDSQFGSRLRASVLPEAQQIGREIAARIAGPIAQRVSAAVIEGVRDSGNRTQAEAAKAGTTTGRTYASALKRAVQGGLANMPTPKIDVDIDAALRSIDRLQSRIEAVSGGEVSLRVDTRGALRSLTEVEQALHRLNNQDARIRLVVEAGGAAAELALIEEDLKRLQKVATIKINTSSAAVRTQLNTIAKVADQLDGKSITINITAPGLSGVKLQMEELLILTAVLARQSPTISVNVNTAASSAQLAALQAQLAGVQASGAATTSMFVVLAGAILILAPLAGPVFAVLIAGVMAVAAALGPLIIAFGVLALALAPVIGAIGAMNQAAEATAQTSVKAAESASQAAQRASQIASSLDSLKMARLSLANTIANAEESERAAHIRVADALRDQAEAAERLREAQLAMNEARREGARWLEDENRKLRELINQQKQASLDARSAGDELANVKNVQKANLYNVERDPNATAEQKAAARKAARDAIDQAQATYDAAKSKADDLAALTRRQRADTAAANRAGVEGTQQVIKAKQDVNRAERDVAEAARDTQAARREEANTQRNNAFAILQARQSVINAERSYQDALRGTGAAATATVPAVETARRKLASLTPEGQRFARFIFGLKDELKALSDAAQRNLLPGLQRGIEAVLPYMPQLIKFVGDTAKVIGDVFEMSLKTFTAPWWREWFAWFATTVGPVIKGAATLFLNFLMGFAGLMRAFWPASEQLGGGILALSAAFAEFGANAGDNPGVQAFIAFAMIEGPKIWSILVSLVKILWNLGVALAPLGSAMLTVVQAVLAFIAALPPGVLLAIAAAIGAVTLAFALFVAGVSVPILGIIAAVVAVVGIIVYAYQRFEWFRVAVQAIWAAIAASALWLWQNVLVPAWNGIAAVIVWAWQNVIQPVLATLVAYWQNTLYPVITMLWTEVFEPTFRLIGALVQGWWTNVVQPIFRILVAVLTGIVIPWVLFLWRNAFQPAFQGIQLAVRVAWAIIQVIFGLLQIALKAIAAVVTWLYRTIFKPIFEAIGLVITVVWRTIIRPIFDALGNYIEDTVAPAFRRGVSAIEKAWKAVQDVAKIPIRFVVNTVLNNGLLAGYNTIAKMFGVKPDNVRITLPPGFAEGGYVRGPGGPRDDRIAAWLSNGEYVIPANRVRELGLDFFNRLRDKGKRAIMARRPGDGSEGLAFADGGLVGKAGGLLSKAWSGLKKGWNAIKDPMGFIREKVQQVINMIPGGRNIVDLVAGVSKKLLGGALTWIKGKITDQAADGYIGPVSKEVGDVQNWVKAQAGKRYIWAGSGPAGYDCSGAVGSVYRMLHGKNPYSRIFSTANMAPYFPKRNQFGTLTAGWAHPGERGASANVGHTAGNVAGLGFESRGGDGFVVGNRASKVTSFARYGTYDEGGWLMPGLTYAFNGTGRAERILTAPQWDDMQEERRQMAGGARGDRHYHLSYRNVDLTAAQFRAMQAADETAERVGRPS